MSENPYDESGEPHRMINEDFGLARDIREMLIKRDLRGQGAMSIADLAEELEVNNSRVSRIRDHHPSCSDWFDTGELYGRAGGLVVTDAGHESQREDEFREYPAVEDPAPQQQSLRGFSENTSVSNAAIKRADGGRKR